MHTVSFCPSEATQLRHKKQLWIGTNPFQTKEDTMMSVQTNANVNGNIKMNDTEPLSINCVKIIEDGDFFFF